MINPLKLKWKLWLLLCSEAGVCVQLKIVFDFVNIKIRNFIVIAQIQLNYGRSSQTVRLPDKTTNEQKDNKLKKENSV